MLNFVKSSTYVDDIFFWECFMKKTLLFVLVCVACVLTFGCKSTGPYHYTFSEATPYTILGEVMISSNDNVESLVGGAAISKDLLKSGTGYIALLAAAKAKYPDCDYVIDVMVDGTTTNYLIVSTHVYSLRGTAIKYNR